MAASFGFLMGTMLALAATAYGQQGTYAHCELVPGAENVYGAIDFRKIPGTDVQIKVNVTGLNASDDVFHHGLHVHAYGDLSDGCDSFEGHWNPYNTNHGAPTDPAFMRHPGDFGNVHEDGRGHIQMVISDYLADLSGANNIVGHGLVIHEHYDDLGRGDSEDSLTSGNSGSRLACCVIGYSDDRHW